MITKKDHYLAQVLPAESWLREVRGFEPNYYQSRVLRELSAKSEVRRLDTLASGNTRLAVEYANYRKHKYPNSPVILISETLHTVVNSLRAEARELGLDHPEYKYLTARTLGHSLKVYHGNLTIIADHIRGLTEDEVTELQSITCGGDDKLLILDLIPKPSPKPRSRP